MKWTRRALAKMLAGTPIGLLLAESAMPLESETDTPEVDCRSYSMKRTTCDDSSGIWERTFLEAWKKHNPYPPGVNSGVPLLWYLRADEETRPKQRFCWAGPHLEVTTPEEERMAASVVQWLGTNCGRSFLHEVEQRAVPLVEEMHERQHTEWNQRMLDLKFGGTA